MEQQENSELDFNTDDYNGFYYTSEKHIRKMDDAFIISKIIEKYPDFGNKDDENSLKQIFSVIVSDSKFINELLKKYDLTVKELFSIIYRNYSFIFNSAYTSKIRKLISGRSYARAIKPKSPRKKRTSGRNSVRKRTHARSAAV